MDNWNEQLLEVINRGREQRELNRRNELAVKHEMAAKERERLNNNKSKAAAVVVTNTPCQMMVASNPNRNRNKSKAASVSSTDKVKIIYDFISKQY